MGEYTVQSGDSLWAIVKNNYSGLSNAQIADKINEIATLSNISDPNKISVGLKLILPEVTNENTLVSTDLEEDITEEEPAVSNNTKQDITAQNKTGKSPKARIEEIQDKKPEPVLDKDGNVVANIRYFESDKTGSLTGLTIMVNSGHGGQSTSDGIFDPGAVENKSGYEEWAINYAYAEELVEKILNEGGNVVFAQGHKETMANAVIDFANTYGNADNSNLRVVSLHCDATGEKSTTASGVTYYYYESEESGKFANNLASAAQKKGLNVRNTSQLENKLCRVAEEQNINSVLIEMGFLNNTDDLHNIIEDGDFQDTLLNSIVKGLG